MAPLDVAGSANYNSAGSGGDGFAIGVISSNPLVVFMPSNAAIAGPNSAANAHQGNNALINQHATESPAWAATVELGTLQLAAETPPITLAVAAMGFFMVVW